jgi:hypothetical protein
MPWHQTLGIAVVMLTGLAICLPALRPRATPTDRWRASRLGVPLVLLAATAILDALTPATPGKNWAVAGIYWLVLGWIGLHLLRALRTLGRKP